MREGPKRRRWRGHGFGLLARALGAMTAMLIATADVNACAPVAIVQGPPDVAGAISEILRHHGVGSDPASCPGQVVYASVSPLPTSGDYSLRITDPFGRVSNRRVRDAEIAATLIETWSTREDAVLLHPRSAALDIESPTPAAAPPEATTGPAQIGVSAEGSRGSDGSIWYGLAATGCASAGPVCLGARARVARDEGWTGPAQDFDQVRLDADLLAIAALPRRFGQLELRPLVGVGLGLTRTSPQSDVGTNATSSYGLRFEAALAAGYVLSRSWTVGGEVGLTVGRPSSSVMQAFDLSIPNPTAIFRVAFGCAYAP